jgi:hypothetical protein
MNDIVNEYCELIGQDPDIDFDDAGSCDCVSG